VNDFQQDGDESTIRFHLKGGRVKTKGINYQAAEAIQEYIAKADIKSIEFVEKERVGHGENPDDHGTHLAQNSSKNQSLEGGGYAHSFRLPAVMPPDPRLPDALQFRPLRTRSTDMPMAA